MINEVRIASRHPVCRHALYSSVSKVALLAPLSVTAVFMTGPALAECPYPTIGQAAECTLTEDNYSGLGYAYYSSFSGDGTDFTLINKKEFSPTMEHPDFSYGINLSIDGSNGSPNSPNGERGGNLVVTNQADITLEHSSYSESGISRIGGISVQSEGGDGVVPDDRGTNGGQGGDSGTVEIVNSNHINIKGNATLGMTADVLGLDVVVRGGDGGDFHDKPTGNQRGGHGGTAQKITIQNSGQIDLGSSSEHVAGDGAGRALNARSYGGSGGAENGSGRAAGEIEITNSGALSLYFKGIGSGQYGVHGIYAASRGGNGVASFDNSDPGGAGADGGAISITNKGDITLKTSGNAITGESAGIMALSRGGDGGTSSNKNTGGDGGSGSGDEFGNSNVTWISHSDGLITTSGDGLRGIVARSEGGRGGDGNGHSASTGGKGGYGGDIQADLGHENNDARIETDGSESYGILAQSIGGLGGSNAGEAGHGGDAGFVGVYAWPGTSIHTKGDYSTGLTFHSVGGGGGTGADFVNVLAGAGGDGGFGGDGNKVTLTTGATIITEGVHSYGLLGQSIGGGGGTGGIGAGLAVALGGDGGGGGSAGNVQANNTGLIQTSGNYATGILAQSLAGGGGAAGTAGGIMAIGGEAGNGSNSAEAYVTSNGEVSTAGNAAPGIVVQTIGGGGGSGGGALGMYAVGGSGSVGGSGGLARAFVVGSEVNTSGDHSYGVVTQSIGGGGGNGGDVIDVSVGGVGVGVGGSGSGGGAGDKACVTNTYDDCDGTNLNDESVAPQGDGSRITTSGAFSHGVVVQSIGGGGGNGGSVNSVSALSYASISVGGAGDGGGLGDQAFAHFDNLTLGTSGDNAKGIIAQSIDGGGGNGGDTQTAAGLTPLTLQIGGSAGGSDRSASSATELAAEVALANSNLTTTGANSGAVLVQSIGGGGGTGGSATGYSASLGLTASVALGGSGGTGGKSAVARANIDNTKVTTGFDAEGNPMGLGGASSHGVSVQSIAGGGGTGGSANANALTIAAPTGEGVSLAISATYAMGGTAGSGGTAGRAVTNLSGTSAIRSGGDGAHGVLVQSIGGDGGSASALSDTAGIENTFSVSVATALGAKGGTAGTGGAAQATLFDQAVIETFGDGANALLVQSIGGGGGDGGIGNVDSRQFGGGTSIDVGIGLGGGGGDGGTGGETSVTLDNADTAITTHGSGARGIVAQSIGGGGGTGQGGVVSASAGFSVGGGSGGEGEGGVEEPSLDVELGGSVNVGASGGSGNYGGKVNAKIGGDVTTTGGDADALLLQSIGGGGGLAGSAGSDVGDAAPTFDIPNPASASFNLAFGGSGGSGGHGGHMDVWLNGGFLTLGDWADAVVVQSIGGGGGAGGSAVATGAPALASLDMALGGTGGAGGDGGKIDVTLSGNDSRMNLETGGYGAHGVLLQSIGGGGGQAADGSANSKGRISVGGGFGGSGGAAGDGGEITVEEGSWFAMKTSGDDAYGLLAQSIGGGGGIGGRGSSIQSDKLLDLNIEVAVGGRGGATGHGGGVDISTGTYMETHGARAFGIVAQSIGGGGGIGGASDTDSLASVEVRGADGAAGIGGTVTVDLTSGYIGTSGAGAHAVIAQSIGGGGGIGGDLSGAKLNVSGAAYGSTDANGNSGAVDVTSQGEITTYGDAAYGIIAQSLAGGGGLYGKDGVLYAGLFGGDAGNSGDVTVTQNGTIRTSGENSIGIFAQSDAWSTPGTVSVAVDGTVTGGTDDGSAVYVATGANNLLDISTDGIVEAGGAVADGNRGMAVIYAGNYDLEYGSSLTVNNAGQLIGDVSFTSPDSDTAGTVNNIDGGVFRPDAEVGANLVNAGDFVLSAFPAPAARTLSAGSGEDGTRILGDFTQSAAGRLLAPVDFEHPLVNQLVVTGDTDLGGKIVPIALSLVPGSEVTVLRGEGAVSGALEVEDTPSVDYSAALRGNVATVSIDKTRFGAAFASLNRNEREVGRHLDEIFRSGTEGYGASLAAISNLSAQEEGELRYAKGLSSLSPGGAHGIAAAQLTLSQTRLGFMSSCRNGENVVSLGEAGNCGWFDVGATRVKQDGAGGYDGNQYGISGGVKFEFAPDWTASFGAGIEKAEYDSDTGLSSADGTNGYIVAGLGRTFGDFEISGALTASYGAYDLTRQIAIPSYGVTATGKSDVTTFGGQVRGAYTFGSEQSYVRPSLDLSIIHTDASGYTENGSGLFDLAVSGHDETALVATPSVEFGGNMTLQNGRQLGGFASLGVSFVDSDDWAVDARFAGASPGAGQFSSSVPVPNTLGRIGFGVTLTDDNAGLQAQAEYGGSFGSGYDSHTLALKLSKQF